jgi:hypothetical protein
MNNRLGKTIDRIFLLTIKPIGRRRSDAPNARGKTE